MRYVVKLHISGLMETEPLKFGSRPKMCLMPTGGKLAAKRTALNGYLSSRP